MLSDPRRYRGLKWFVHTYEQLGWYREKKLSSLSGDEGLIFFDPAGQKVIILYKVNNISINNLFTIIAWFY